MLEANNAVFVCIDVQKILAAVMYEKEPLFDNLKKSLAGCAALGVPVIWTEQNPDRLGPTRPDIAACMPDSKPLSKMSFSCLGEPTFVQHLQQLQRRQVLLAGIEAHICVYQTACDLVAQGYEVQVVADCVSSRVLYNKEIGLAKITAGGAELTTTEIMLFELLKTAAAPQFRDIAKIVK
ncbi:isochorismatase family protein [Thermodesulfobacteriota bacterium]